MTITNRFKGTCLTCRTYVAPNQGTATKVDGSWSVFCRKCGPSPRPSISQELSAKAPDATIALRFVSDRIQIRPAGYLGTEMFDAYRAACGGAEYSRNERCNYATVDLVGAIVTRLAKAGFKLDTDPAITAAVQAWEARAQQETAAAEGRAAEIDALLRARGLALFPFQAQGVSWLAPRDRAILGDDMGLGKAQPVGSPVLCPTGWRKIGDLSIGDMVIGSDGSPCTVTGVYPQGSKPAYRAIFSDGSSAECCMEHLWYVQTALQRKRGHHGQVLPLAVIADSLVDGAGNRQHFIPIVDPVEFSPAGRLPIDPYALGVLLGDGGFSGNSCLLTNGDQNVIARVGERLASLDVTMVHTDRTSWRVCGRGAGVQNQVISVLRELGLWGCMSVGKFIPEKFMLSSIEDRSELLRGLMDTDGSPRAGARTIEYSTSSERLAVDVKFLCESLGMSVRVSSRIPKYTYKGEKRDGSRSWRLNVNPGSIVPFWRPGKLAKWAGGAEHKYKPTRSFVSVEPIGERECVCISVSAANKLYVTSDFVVTHNTIQALAALPEGARAVVVGPAVAKGVWERECKRWRPDLTPVVLSGRGSFRWPSAGELVITNYDVLADAPMDAKDRAELNAKATKAPIESAAKIFAKIAADDVVLELHVSVPAGLCVIADEAHAVKGKRNKVARCARFGALADAAFEAGGRIWLLTATPILNSPPELWNLLSLIRAQKIVFGSYPNFKRLCGGASNGFGTTWEAGGIDAGSIGPKLREVMLRRMKTDVLDQLPAKTVEIVEVALDTSTMRRLDAITAELAAHGIDLAAAIKAAASSNSIAFEQIARARALLATAKAAHAMAMADDLEEAGEPAIVFSAHRAPVDVLAQRPGWATITGDTPPAERTKIEESFQRGELRGIAGTIKAMGVAITLTRACHVIFIDSEWTPKLNEQAEDRAYRIGQARAVNIVYLKADHDVDDRVFELCAIKRGIVARTVDAAAHRDGALAQRTNASDALASARASGDSAQRERDNEELAAKVRVQRAKADADRARRQSAVKSERANTNRGWSIPPEAFETTERAAATPAEEWAVLSLAALTAMDGDYAREDNGVGFSQADTTLGHTLSTGASAGLLNDGEWKVALLLLRKYHGQIGEAT
jgi:hypothetical protein